MTMPRSKIVDPDLTPWYHIISRTVRGEYLLESADGRRKQELEERLEQLSKIFSIEVAGYAVLDNHLHNLIYLDPRRAQRWSKAEVLRRWALLHPPRGPDRKPLKSIAKWIQENVRNQKLVRKLRKRLMNLGWFMKELKEPLARKANEEDGVRGEEAVLATCAYIDLNPLAAGMVRLPEEARYTSLQTRLAWCARQGRLPDLQAAWQGAVAAVRKLHGSERGLWLCPLEDRRAQGAARVGVLDGFSLGSYLRLVDATSRLVRPGKARIGPEVTALLDRLKLSWDTWQQTLTQLFARPQLLGVAFSFDRARLRAAAARRRCRHVANLNGCHA
jgi:hypothetical protein